MKLFVLAFVALFPIISNAECLEELGVLKPGKIMIDGQEINYDDKRGTILFLAPKDKFPSDSFFNYSCDEISNLPIFEYFLFDPNKYANELKGFFLRTLPARTSGFSTFRRTLRIRAYFDELDSNKSALEFLRTFKGFPQELNHFIFVAEIKLKGNLLSFQKLDFGFENDTNKFHDPRKTGVQLMFMISDPNIAEHIEFLCESQLTSPLFLAIFREFRNCHEVAVGAPGVVEIDLASEPDLNFFDTEDLYVLTLLPNLKNLRLPIELLTDKDEVCMLARRLTAMQKIVWVAKSVGQSRNTNDFKCELEKWGVRESVESGESNRIETDFYLLNGIQNLQDEILFFLSNFKERKSIKINIHIECKIGQDNSRIAFSEDFREKVRSSSTFRHRVTYTAVIKGPCDFSKLINGITFTRDYLVLDNPSVRISNINSLRKPIIRIVSPSDQSSAITIEGSIIESVLITPEGSQLKNGLSVRVSNSSISNLTILPSESVVGVEHIDANLELTFLDSKLDEVVISEVLFLKRLEGRNSYISKAELNFNPDTEFTIGPGFSAGSVFLTPKYFVGIQKSHLEWLSKLTRLDIAHFQCDPFVRQTERLFLLDIRIELPSQLLVGLKTILVKNCDLTFDEWTDEQLAKTTFKTSNGILQDRWEFHLANRGIKSAH